jgi:hypothetical protein
MSDFVITTDKGDEFGVDDVIMDPTAQVVKYISRHEHQRRMMKMSEVRGLRRERWGHEGGPEFDKSEIPPGWHRPT